MKQHFMNHRRRYMAFLMVMAFSVMTAVAAFAQTVTSTLDINTSTITNNLFTGANVILGALLGVVMLIAGFRFGANILDRLASAIKL